MGEASERSIQSFRVNAVERGVFRAIGNANRDRTSRRARAPAYNGRRFASQGEHGWSMAQTESSGKIA
jgi:hypothetical protein